jgi:putative ABC transport system permease protein
VWQDGNFNGLNVTMPMSLFTRLYGPQPTSYVALEPAPGVSTAELADRARAARLDPALRIYTPSELARKLASDLSFQLAPFYALQRGLLAVAFIAVLSTLLLVGVQRRRELAMLAAVGMEPTELSGMVLVEGTVVALVGSFVASIGAIGMYTAFHLCVPILIGFRDPWRLAPMSLAVWVPIAVATVLAAAALPAWRNARIPVVEALQYE